MQPKEKADNDPWVPLTDECGENTSCEVNTICGSSSSNGVDTRNPFSETSFSMQFPVDPLKQMVDSDTYIQTLERKLEKLKKARTKKSEPTSKDIITSLALFHDDQMRRFLDNSGAGDSQFLGRNDETITTVSAIQRRLHPERQPLNAEEVVELVHDDVVAKTFEELHISDSQTSNLPPQSDSSTHKEVNKQNEISTQQTRSSACKDEQQSSITTEQTAVSPEKALKQTIHLEVKRKQRKTGPISMLLWRSNEV